MFTKVGFNTAQAKLDALNRSLATIEFAMDGTVLDANENFLRVIGYDLGEIKGKHHSLFVDPAFAKSAEYERFWQDLRRGTFASGEFLRFGKGGAKVWLEATYNPVFDEHGKPERVVKFASDITAKKNETSRLMTMIDGMPVAVMTVDPKNDFRINYLNATSEKTLGAIEQYLPVKVADMLGASIDIFHKNPSHQRQMLADDRLLPHKTKIRIGPEVLELQITAIKGPDGEYIAPMLTWAIITNQESIATDVSQVVAAVSQAVDDMQRSADGLAGAAENASEKASSVATSSEQMTGAIHEISGQVSRVSDRAQQIAIQAATTDTTVRLLAENARKVDAVVAMINSIAAQTNLLALNATIESARAGEAGKGFAVVAGEVKALAGQTAKATDEITQQVSAIQKSTEEAVLAIGTITRAVDELSNLTTAMAGAVEEQAATTQEMSTNITGVSTAAAATGELAGSVSAIASVLAGHSDGLKGSVERFLKAG
ncbi:PAS domain-containing methyl-accepting chemotaxis protein [Asticcacaulis sp. 201]|uniref:methyl-accepting chemotaxis protein n=1 Tax=Asticcacaulis sp. 201 TaxID=3028787 RepID=UPI0029170EB9|nr:PAS domain-containing methyl-accepting chemotaxis protein [Asticcacaulis sp. 201]MDV6330951.1 PAS domain-containing methyl-accepting chemotaxis protein [Asticcacaulis sp. 201]